MQWNHEQLQNVRRVFRRLCEKDSFLAAVVDVALPGQYGVFVKRNRWIKPVLRINSATLQLFIKADLVIQQENNRYRPSAAGRALYRRLYAQAAGETITDSFAAQHQLRHIDNEGVRRTTQTPLDWFKARNNGTGVIRLTSAELVSAERLQTDYERSGLRARLTIDWTRPIVQEGYTHGDSTTAQQIDARMRFAAAMGYVGPGLQEGLFAICCELAGLEEVESRFGWPRRSAKLVLKIALTRLTYFYQTKTVPAPEKQCAAP